MLSRRRLLASSTSAANTLLAVIIVVVLLASTVGAFLFITGDTSASGAEVKIGSVVKVDYTGKLPDGRVFDTSLLSVAQDNSTYLKSPLFTYRSSNSAYAPLQFTVGDNTLIDGFEYGLMGMKVGDTKTLTIPVSEGYGPLDSSKLVTINLNETVPVFAYMTAAQFKTTYGVTAVSQTVVQDPHYGWDVRVLSVDSDMGVFIQNEPTSGSTYKAYAYSSDASFGWNVLVTSVDPTQGQYGEITLHHQLDASSAGNAKGYDSTDSTKFVVSSVDLANGTAVLNKNSEVYGVTLTFEVKIISIS